MNERPDDYIPMTQEERDAIYRRIMGHDPDPARLPMTAEERQAIYDRVMARPERDCGPWRPSLFDRLLPWLTIALYLAIALLPWWLFLFPSRPPIRRRPK